LHYTKKGGNKLKRIISVANFKVDDEKIKRINKVAPDFEVYTGDKAKEGLKESEIIFGYAPLEELANAKYLKWLHASTAGVDFYLKQGTFREDVILTNSAGMHGISISEHMLGLTLMLMRRLHNYVTLQSKHKWEYLGEIKSICGSNITVVGLGGIGSLYAAKCKAMGANVTGVVRRKRDTTPDCVNEIYTIDKLPQTLKNADVVALALPQTSETMQLIDKECMQSMKKGVIIINIGRGTAIDQEALTELLESGHIGGAGLDVTDPEPLPEDSKLWDLPNVIITPHISGGSTLPLTGELIFNRFLEYLDDYAAGKPFKKTVDKQAGY